MKNTLIALVVGLSLSAPLYAGKMVKNNEQLEDQVHGYGQVNSTAAEEPEKGGKYRNQGQREDSLHGYGQVEAATSEPAAIKIGKKNNQQKEDAVHGYSN